ncbi:pre-60S factor rei1 [Ophidiomyces ophidiicola]|nr:pre-60S factor rei1 [Ophidiomyces ophidiicola]KAI1931036.1 pre-60S factor rei1 [Ophidiomyces ophidiicola]KAI2148890.1 pre-60S factor rei1 [Ophidiomyces ophidiicola]KAI2266112.1 pre-60S factor rei1 [Ophidiomyces ophidiicola]
MPPPQDSVGAPSTHPFTCNTCQVAFRGSDAQRAHMRGDWHRYNLKRRVASLPPLSSETFADKVLTVQASNSAAAARATFERTCAACQKTYFSDNAFINHMGSQKHRLKEAISKKNGTLLDDSASVVSGTFSMGEPINAPTNVISPETIVEEEFSTIIEGMKDTSLDVEDPVLGRTHRPSQSQVNDRRHPSIANEMAISRCLFCNCDSFDIHESISHMHKSHGMFIPEQDYLVDLTGLIKYLQAKVIQNNECLYCHKLKSTVPGIQTHMRDKGHCMIAFESEEEMIEIGQFYDFTGTYSDDEDEPLERRAGLPNGATGEDDGWETDTSVSSVDSAELGAMPIDDHSHLYSKLSKHKHHSNEPRSHRSVDGFHSHAHEHSRAVFYSDFELHLPSGRTAGHRSLAKYYKQNLQHHPPPAEQTRQKAIEAGPADNEEEESTNSHNSNTALVSRANGGIGMLGATASQKREVRAAEVRDRKREQRSMRDFQWSISKRSNHQKHFRVSLGFPILLLLSSYWILRADN